LQAAASSGNLVDDILNGAYEEGGQGADILLEDDEQNLDVDDIEHLI